MLINLENMKAHMDKRNPKTHNFKLTIRLLYLILLIRLTFRITSMKFPSHGS